MITAHTARVEAQSDVNLPLPNMLLLIDSSGSMEYKSSSEQFPACFPSGDQPSERSRWIELVEVLTGSISDYRCATVDRASVAFLDEYRISGQPPPDYQYKNAYHRPLSGSCVAGPGSLPSGAFDSASIRYHQYGDLNQPCTSFQQAGDGVLDTYRSTIRFGLMTFDTRPHPGDGYAGTAPNYADGIAGAWSYFLGTPAQGKPAKCISLEDIEVGARNSAAPPWEGRLITFGNPAATAAEVNTKNQAIREVLLSSRPYGATPIAGFLTDARDFLWNDENESGALDYAPRDDPFVKQGCREQKLILLTDGEPNLDLRPFCAAQGEPKGVCPFQKPEDIALDLATASPAYKRIKTSVIGFASPTFNVTGTDEECSSLTSADLTEQNGKCAKYPNNKQLQICCTLNRIAFNGGTERAWFADNKEELRQAIRGAITPVAPVTSRTQPAIASGNGVGDAFAASYRFHSSFAPRQFDLWSGVLERQRYICKDGVPEAQPISPDKGDDFVANVNSGDPALRRMYTVLADTDPNTNLIHSERSIRPDLTEDDGAGLVDSTLVNDLAQNFPALVPPKAMSINNTTCTKLNATQCRDHYLKWTVGLDNGTDYHRCEQPGTVNCNLVGDIYHSTPAVVSRPTAFVRDESYDAFKTQQKKRPLMLYTSTNDGFLHAFKVAPSPADESGQPVNTKANNELWSFIPPAVLPSLPSQYPGTHQVLLDGRPVVKDVVAQVSGSAYRFERDTNTARQGGGTWRTILLQGFGGARSGYFALDITNPEPTGSNGPQFLWQLTEDDQGNPIFGRRGTTPLITTLFFEDDGVEKEIAVAVLPGGHGGPPTGSSCDREVSDQLPLDTVSSNYQPRTKVNCYDPDERAARSLTIVRLDTGEIIRTFRRTSSEVPPAWRSKVVQAPLDSPITGQPVAFPAQVGAVADRVFVGDQDGTLWKLELSSTDPDDWSMDLFFDTFTGQPALSGQPIETPPILSIKEDGNITVAVATGDQEVLTAADVNNYVWSLTDELQPNNLDFKTEVNWYLQFSQGERITGPISLFNEQLFFSTYRPQSDSTKVCEAGTGRVWGMHFVLPEEPSDLSLGGAARLNDGDRLVQYLTGSQVVGGGESVVIFGVTVAQQPSCAASENTTEDPYLGYGNHTAVTGITPGAFELVMHTGKAGSTISGGQTRVATIPLETPPSSARLDSWAAIVE